MREIEEKKHAISVQFEAAMRKILLRSLDRQQHANLTAIEAAPSYQKPSAIIYKMKRKK
jgi:hypothetical protein